jgi:plastocyanin
MLGRVSALAALLTLAINIADAATLFVKVVDADGHAVVDAVVVASSAAASAVRHSTATAVMDQLNKTFVPEVLVVREGTSVVFPNTDSVAHQVYSFSPAKRFALPLYRGQPHAPVLFDQAGLVVLGCNIHDSMLGYIYVTDSPYFARTDAGGKAALSSLPADQYQITVWTPRVTTQAGVQTVTVESADAEVGVRLKERVHAPTPAVTPNRVRDY